MRRVDDITTTERDEMFSILDRYFLHATREAFERDLDEKDWVLLVTSRATGAVRGFSTLMRLTTSVGGERIGGFYSGDTVMESRYWGRPDTSRGIGVLLRHMIDEAHKRPDATWYWFLISSTYRSYRLLPMLFREFYPTPGAITPAAHDRALAALAREKGGLDCDPRSRIVRFRSPTVFRRGSFQKSPEDQDVWEKLFLEANPGSGDGDRLASLAVLSRDNLTRVGRRLLRQAAAVPQQPRSVRTRSRVERPDRSPSIP